MNRCSMDGCSMVELVVMIRRRDAALCQIRGQVARSGRARALSHEIKATTISKTTAIRS